MIDKAELLRKMRKHAKNFSSATTPHKAIDQKSINHALALIDFFAKDSNFISSKKMDIKIPEFLKILRTENNLDFLRIKRTNSETTNYKNCINEKKKGKDKFKNAEKKLLKLLSTKNC